MTPHVVADIGNTRIKWGLCALDAPRVVRTAALADDPTAREQQLAAWLSEPPLSSLSGPLSWVLASVQPRRCDRLRDWLVERGQRVALLEKAAQLPLEVALEKPD